MTDSRPPARFRPRLATAVRLGLVGVLLLLGLTFWLSMPLLGGIVDKANRVRDDYLPDLTRWRYNTQRIEQLYGFIQTIYWSNDAQVVRSSRLQAQVLLDSFAPGSQLTEQAGGILLGIQTLSKLRDSQRATLNEVRTLAGKLLENTAPPAERNDQLSRFAAACSRLGLIGTDWQALQQEAGNLPAPEPEARDDVARLQTLFARLQTLETQVERTYRQALEQQKQLAATLNTDTALKTQQIAKAVGHEATQVRSYGLLSLLLLGTMALAVLYLFQRFLLRPILLCNQALEQLNSESAVQLPERTLFREVDTICQSVRQYGDMTRQLQQANRELMLLSQQDSLTGLSNRRHFDNALAAEHARASRYGHALALLLLDVDHFKTLNDRHGHQCGDDCLRQLANVLRQFSRRPGDLAARYGGEEFVLLLPQISLEQSRQLAERVRLAIGELCIHTDTGDALHFTASTGMIHTSDALRHTPESLIHQADLALYKAKQLGRNRVEVAEEAVPQS